ncbi:MAG: hypothetical protein JKX72_04830 [Robiginitomaculum sp.]|nr:hypothetical protein [Robiginitomaculum sp.]
MNIAKILLISLALIVLNACGFKPMHSQNGLGLSGISYRDISVQTAGNEKIDFLLKQALRDRVGDNQSAPYILRVRPVLTRDSIGIRGDDIASRYDLNMVTGIELLDAKTGDVLWTDSVRTISTFSAPQDPYATISAQSNANERLAENAVERILMSLSGYKPRS